MIEVVMPKLSDTMEEGTVSHWFVGAGDMVHPGDVIAEVETDKATMELAVYDSGVVEEVLVQVGESASVGTPVAILGSGNDGGSVRSDRGSGDASAQSQGDEVPVDSMGLSLGIPTELLDENRDRSHWVRSSPLARKVAREHGIDMSTIKGSGPYGRVVRDDLQAALMNGESHDPLAHAGRDADELVAEAFDDGQAPLSSVEVPVSTVRRVSARRLAEATTIPHFELTRLVDAEKLVAMRIELNNCLQREKVKVSLNDLLIKACAKALVGHMELNSSWADDKIRRYDKVNMGLAVASSDGLVVPVIKDVATLGLRDIARESRRLVDDVRRKTLDLSDINDATFTISNLGAYGIDYFKAVINPPQAAILAVGSASLRPMVIDSRIAVRASIYLTLSVDHRVQDGAGAAEFLGELVDILESPLGILS